MYRRVVGSICGRYYVDDDTAREIEKLIRQVDEKMKRETKVEPVKLAAKDIHPSEISPILTASQGRLKCVWQRWGFPGGGAEGRKKQLIFNARSESALEKPFFRDSILHRRAVIPAAGFYEWSRNREKNVFYREGRPVLFMAGCFRHYEDGGRFVILTTSANASMRPVHDRMPLVLEREEVAAWILDGERTEGFLRGTPPLLSRRTDYEQMDLADYF